MAGETTTPNIGLQIAAFDQSNWQVPTNYNWNLLDLIFGGEVQVPALDVGTLTVASGIGALLASAYVAETPSGAVPGTVYTLSYTPGLVLAVCYNGSVLRAGVDYTVVGAVVTLGFSTSAGDSVYALYFK